MISDMKSAVLLDILGIDPLADVFDMRGHPYFVADADDLKVRTNGETFKVLLRDSPGRNRPTSETVKSVVDLGKIVCVHVYEEKYGKDGAALFFYKSDEDRSILAKIIG